MQGTSLQSLGRFELVVKETCGKCYVAQTDATEMPVVTFPTQVRAEHRRETI